MASHQQHPQAYLLFFLCFILAFTWTVDGAPAPRVLRSGRSLVVANAQEQIAAQTQTLRNSIPRVNFKFQPVSANFDLGNPNYYESLVMIALFGILPALIVLILSLVFFCARACNFCSCCCGDSEPAKPSLCGRIVLRFIVSISSIGILAALILGIAGTTGIGADVTTFSNSLLSGVSGLQMQAVQVSSSLTTAAAQGGGNVSSSSSTWATVNSTITTAANLVQTSIQGTQGFEKTRLYIYIFVLLFVFLVTAFCLWCSWRGHGKMACLVMPFTVVALVSMLVFFGVHLALTLAMHDFCKGVGSFVLTSSAGLPPAPPAVGIASYLPCFNETATAALKPINAASYGVTLELNSKATDPQFTNSFQLVTTNPVIMRNSTGGVNSSATRAASSGVHSFVTTRLPCFCPASSIPSGPSDAQCNGQNPFANQCLRTVVDGTASNSSAYAAFYIQRLINGGIISGIQTNAEAAVLHLAQTYSSLNSSRSSLQALKDCTFLNPVLKTIVVDVCPSTSKNLDFLWLGSLLASVFLLFITIANIYGIKRYGFEEQVDRATLVRQRGNDRKERISERKNGLAKKAPKKKQRDLYYDMHL